MPHLTVLVGAPGAGKSTYAKKLAGRVVTTDGWRESDGQDDYGRTLASAYKQINAHLAAGEDVVFDSPAANPNVRKAAIGIARKHNATVSATVVDASMKQCLDAQRDRAHPAPFDAVARVWHDVNRQAPKLRDEGFDYVNTVRRRR
jgi:predicted kinase